MFQKNQLFFPFFSIHRDSFITDSNRLLHIRKIDWIKSTKSVRNKPPGKLEVNTFNRKSYTFLLFIETKNPKISIKEILFPKEICG